MVFAQCMAQLDTWSIITLSHSQNISMLLQTLCASSFEHVFVKHYLRFYYFHIIKATFTACLPPTLKLRQTSEYNHPVYVYRLRQATPLVITVSPPLKLFVWNDYCTAQIYGPFLNSIRVAWSFLSHFIVAIDHYIIM